MDEELLKRKRNMRYRLLLMDQAYTGPAQEAPLVTRGYNTGSNNGTVNLTVRRGFSS